MKRVRSTLSLVAAVSSVIALAACTHEPHNAASPAPSASSTTTPKSPAPAAPASPDTSAPAPVTEGVVAPVAAAPSPGSAVDRAVQQLEDRGDQVVRIDAAYTAPGAPDDARVVGVIPVQHGGAGLAAEGAPVVDPVFDPAGTNEDTPAPAPEGKSVPVPEVKPAPAPEVKPAPAPEVKPAPAPEVKPAPAPEDKPAPEAYKLLIHQGDEIYVTDPVVTSYGVVVGRAECTVAYVDKQTHTALTAAHCAEDGSTVYNKDGRAIGTFDRTRGFHATQPWHETIGNDVAVIRLNPDVGAGENRYSGEYTGYDAQPGDTVCTYSRIRNTTDCHTVKETPYYWGVSDQGRVFDGTAPAMGDSGGPVWSPGHGFVGVQDVTWGGNRGGGYAVVDPTTEPSRPLADQAELAPASAATASVTTTEPQRPAGSATAQPAEKVRPADVDEHAVDEPAYEIVSPADSASAGEHGAVSVQMDEDVPEDVANEDTEGTSGDDGEEGQTAATDSERHEVIAR